MVLSVVLLQVFGGDEGMVVDGFPFCAMVGPTYKKKREHNSDRHRTIDAAQGPDDLLPLLRRKHSVRKCKAVFQASNALLPIVR